MTGDNEALRRKRRAPRPALLAILTPVVFLAIAQLRRLSHFSSFEHDLWIEQSSQSIPPRPKRYAIVNFVDDLDYYLWGVYSIHHQMEKFNMTPSIDHVALIPNDMSKKSRALLQEWLGKDNVRQVDKTFIRDKVPQGCWIPVFSKLEFFNLTMYDKLIALDNDIFIRTNIEHWFKYPAPAATHARGTIEWNSGAMVIKPNSTLYDILLQHLPLTRPFHPSKEYSIDPWNSYDGHQGFLSAFFTSNVTDDHMFTMSYASSMLSTDLEKRKENFYFWKYRRNMIETLHFTQHKPWKKKTDTNHPAVCSMLREWFESVKDAPRDKLPKLPNVMRSCPPPESETEESIEVSIA